MSTEQTKASEVVSPADNIVTLIMGDLNGRKGFHICDLENEIQDDIRKEWVSYIQPILDAEIARLKAELREVQDDLNDRPEVLIAFTEAQGKEITKLKAELVDAVAMKCRFKANYELAVDSLHETALECDKKEVKLAAEKLARVRALKFLCKIRCSSNFTTIQKARISDAVHLLTVAKKKGEEKI